MTAIGFVILAGAGAVVRWQIGQRLPRPLGTLLVNIAGAFLLALLIDPEAGPTVGANSHSDLIYGGAGIGALTTFSTLIHELRELARGNRIQLFAYLGATIIFGIGAAWLGLQIN